MAVYEDLSPYGYFDDEGEALNIGWLGTETPLQSGEVPEGILSRIAWLCLNEPVAQTRGFHGCELCSSPEGVQCYLVVEGELHLLGTNEIRIPGDGVTYAAPSLVLHYLVDHGYRPPEEFLRAAERLPNQLPPGWRVKPAS